MYGAFHGRGRTLWSVHHTETVVLARVRLVTQASRTDMEKVRGEFQTLYQREEPHPPGIPLSTHVEPDKVNDEIPSEAEL